MPSIPFHGIMPSNLSHGLTPSNFQVGNTDEETQQLLLEHNSFKEKARETREKVKLLLQLADTLVEKGHAHAPNIKLWVEEVDETYKNFSTRMDKYREKVDKLNKNRHRIMFKLWRYCVQMKLKFDLFLHNEMIIYLTFLHDSCSDQMFYWIPEMDFDLRWLLFYFKYLKLEHSLGVLTTEPNTSLNLDKDRNSDPILETRIKDGVADLKLNEEKRKSAKRKEFIMAELLETERSYVKVIIFHEKWLSEISVWWWSFLKQRKSILFLSPQDLELALAKFYEPMKKAADVPTALKGKESVIFGNLEDICHFHRNIFLKELEKYETMPEDVGHAFVTWVSKNI